MWYDENELDQKIEDRKWCLKENEYCKNSQSAELLKLGQTLRTSNAGFISHYFSASISAINLKLSKNILVCQLYTPI